MRQRLQFALERWIQGGVLPQLLLMIALIAAVATAGGLLAWSTGAISRADEAVWWAFLRLTDPGYLGDDEGAWLRTLSTAITVLGYVLFMGSLIAILTQGLHGAMQRLESGLAPIAMSDHLLVLGWTNRTPAIVRELLLSEGRVRRFLRRHGTRRLRIVVLAEHVDAALRLELRELVGPILGDHHVYLRSGHSLRIEHLERVDYRRAAAILLPGADYASGGAANTDARVVKTLLSIASGSAADGLDEWPHLVAEVFDAGKASVARGAYPHGIDVLASDRFISRLIAQNVRHRGLSHVYTPLLTHGRADDVYVREAPAALVGRSVREVAPWFDRAVLIGLVRPREGGFAPHLNPRADVTIAPEDRLVAVARSYEDAGRFRAEREPEPRAEATTERVRPRRRREASAPRRVLVLGWSHKAPPLLAEFGSYGGADFRITVVSRVPVARREATLARLDLPDTFDLRHVEADYTVRDDLERLDVAAYDNVVFLGSSWLDTSQETDARTVLGYVVVRELLDRASRPPDLLVELVDPANVQLFAPREGEVIVSPVLVSHMLAHVALRRELLAVFEELFGSGGAEIAFRAARDYGLAGREVAFAEVRRRVASQGETALGLRPAGAVTDRDLLLNPPPGRRRPIGDHDEIVVLATAG